MQPRALKTADHRSKYTSARNVRKSSVNKSSNAHRTPVRHNRDQSDFVSTMDESMTSHMYQFSDLLNSKKPGFK